MFVSRERKKRSEIRQWLVEYKSTLRCERCGFDHPASICFHHRSGVVKLFDISKAPSTEKSIEEVKRELLKCEALCANCHLIHHHEDRQMCEADRLDIDAHYDQMLEDEL